MEIYSQLNFKDGVRLSNTQFELMSSSDFALTANAVSGKFVIDENDNVLYRGGDANNSIWQIATTADVDCYGICDTSSSTVAKVVTVAKYTLATGKKINVKFTATNSATNPTLNVNATGAKPIYKDGVAVAADYIKAGKTYEFLYNGTQYELVGNDCVVFTGATASTNGAAGLVPAPLIADKDKVLCGDGAWKQLTAADVGALSVYGGVINGALGVDYKNYYNVLSLGTMNGVGVLKITLPIGWTNNYLTIDVDFFNYSASPNISNVPIYGKLTVTGMNYSIEWRGASSTVIGSLVSKSVKLGYDGEKCCILIGDADTSWNLRGLNVSRVLAGNADNRLITGWDAEIIEDVLITNIYEPILNRYFDVDTVDGHHASDFVLSLNQSMSDGELPLYNETFTGIGRSGKKIEASISELSANNAYRIPTSEAVINYVTNAITLQGFLQYQGTLGVDGTITALPSIYNRGDVYRIITAGTYAGQVCEIGDMLACIVSRADGELGSNSDWTIWQTNIDGAVTTTGTLTSNTIVLGDGNKTIKSSSYTISTTASVSSTAIMTANAISNTYLKLAGGKLTDFLTLHANPTNNLHAATKQYVDGAAGNKCVQYATSVNGTTGNITTATHGCGVLPIVMAKESTGAVASIDISIDASGNISWRSKATFNGQIILIGNPNF